MSAHKAVMVVNKALPVTVMSRAQSSVARPAPRAMPKWTHATRNPAQVHYSAPAAGFFHISVHSGPHLFILLTVGKVSLMFVRLWFSSPHLLFLNFIEISGGKFSSFETLCLDLLFSYDQSAVFISHLCNTSRLIVRHNAYLPLSWK